MEYDVFICHASEDKQEFVEPLSNALIEAGLNVWYDRFELKLGDSLRRKIDQGLSSSRYGVVVLSKAFFNKEWPQDELDALVGKENEERRKVILPIWHNIDAKEVTQFSPILASKLAVRSDVGMDNIVTQIIEACEEEVTSSNVSVFQTGSSFGLRERCLEIIRKDDIIAWRKLINQVSNPIPERLKDWKKQGEEAGNKGGKIWEEAVYSAALICLPGLVPILSSVEAANLQFWKESLGILRRLSILEDEMGGGLCKALRIGGSMLSVAGFLGLSIAASLKLFDFANEWMYLRLPGRTQGERETFWMNFYLANHLPDGVSFDKRDPFVFLRNLAKTDSLNNFFPDENRIIHNLFLGNLLASLIELRQCALNQREREALFNRPQDFHCEVFPFWCIMGTEQFVISTLELFGDSQAVYSYVFPNHQIDIREFWSIWKQWKIVCVKYWRTDYGFHMPMIKFMTLPGEPVG